MFQDFEGFPGNMASENEMNASHPLGSELHDGWKREVGMCGASQISGIIVPITGCIKLPQTGDSTK